jgi:hypothetical protein
MYFYIFITNGSCTPSPGCRKALSLPEGTPFGVDTQYGKKQFLSPLPVEQGIQNVKEI